MGRGRRQQLNRLASPWSNAHRRAAVVARKLELVLVLACLVVSALGQGPPQIGPPHEGPRPVAARWLALVAARVVTAPGSVLARVTIVVRDGRVTAVGDVTPPAVASVIDCRGRVVHAGLVEPFLPTDVLALDPDAGDRQWDADGELLLTIDSMRVAVRIGEQQVEVQDVLPVHEAVPAQPAEGGEAAADDVPRASEDVGGNEVDARDGAGPGTADWPHEAAGLHAAFGRRFVAPSGARPASRVKEPRTVGQVFVRRPRLRPEATWLASRRTAASFGRDMPTPSRILPWAAAGALLACAACADVAVGGLRGKLSGTGATFPAPLYQKWFKTYYTDVDRGVRVNYSSQGSSQGVAAVILGTHDFGASDAAMTDGELRRVTKGGGVLMLPMTAGAVVVAYNAAVEDLRLDRATLAGIFLGEIVRWDDPAIVATNPDVALPRTRINVMVRSDGSGTTYAFTNHLAAISPDWQQRYGTSKSVNWPDGFLQKKGNEGVAAGVAQTPNSIGYVEFSYAHGTLRTAALQNRSGRFVPPTIPSLQAGLAGCGLPADLRLFVPDPVGEHAFPIVTYSWILAYRRYDDPLKAEILRTVLDWCLTEGQTMSEELGYVPLPPVIAERVREAVQTIEGAAAGDSR